MAPPATFSCYLLRYSHITSATIVKGRASPWEHFVSRNSFKILLQAFPQEATDDSGVKTTQTFLKIMVGLEIMDSTSLQDLVCQQAVEATRVARFLPGESIFMIIGSYPNLAIRYRLENGQYRRMQLLFASQTDFDRIIDLFKSVDLPVRSPKSRSCNNHARAIHSSFLSAPSNATSTESVSSNTDSTTQTCTSSLSWNSNSNASKTSFAFLNNHASNGDSNDNSQKLISTSILRPGPSFAESTVHESLSAYQIDASRACNLSYIPGDHGSSHMTDHRLGDTPREEIRLNVPNSNPMQTRALNYGQTRFPDGSLSGVRRFDLPHRFSSLEWMKRDKSSSNRPFTPNQTRQMTSTSKNGQGHTYSDNAGASKKRKLEDVAPTRHESTINESAIVPAPRFLLANPPKKTSLKNSATSKESKSTTPKQPDINTSVLTPSLFRPVQTSDNSVGPEIVTLDLPANVASGPLELPALARLPPDHFTSKVANGEAPVLMRNENPLNKFVRRQRARISTSSEELQQRGSPLAPRFADSLISPVECKQVSPSANRTGSYRVETASTKGNEKNCEAGGEISAESSARNLFKRRGKARRQ